MRSSLPLTEKQKEQRKNDFDKYRKGKIARTCPVCEITFYIERCVHQIFCSKTCRFNRHKKAGRKRNLS